MASGACCHGGVASNPVVIEEGVATQVLVASCSLDAPTQIARSGCAPRLLRKKYGASLTYLIMLVLITFPDHGFHPASSVPHD